MIIYDKKTIDDIDVKGKRVLLRAEFNVPLDKKTNEITDDRRIRAALPTISALVERGARLIIVSHLGRPKGFDKALSLKPVAVRLSELLNRDVTIAEDVVGDDAAAKAAALKDGEILLLENVRYHKEETKNNPVFAKNWLQWLRFMQVTLLAPFTVLTLRRRALPHFCRLSRVTRSTANSKCSVKPSPILFVR